MSSGSDSSPSGDLTGILQYAKKMQESGELPEPPSGVVLEESPIEKLEAFESLEDYASAHPMPDPLEMTPPADPLPIQLPPTETPLEASVEASIPEPAALLSAEPLLPQEGLPALEAPAPLLEESPPPVVPEFSAAEELAPAPDSPPVSTFSDLSDIPGLVHPADPPPLESTSTWDLAPSELLQQAARQKLQPQARSAPPPQGLSGGPKTASNPNPLESLKSYSEQLSEARAIQTRPLTFQLLIEGPLEPNEKENLLAFLEEKKIGISAQDLEPQWTAQRLLLPQLSEYTGVALVQLLRGTRASLSLSFSADSTPLQSVIEKSNWNPAEPTWTPHRGTENDALPPAEAIVVSSDGSTLPHSQWIGLDTITATALLSSERWEQESAYQLGPLLEGLKRELKYKAHHKGAHAILNFQIKLYPLSHLSPQQVQVIATGLAVQKAETASDASSDLTHRSEGDLGL
jgi:hypothetical protein